MIIFDPQRGEYIDEETGEVVDSPAFTQSITYVDDGDKLDINRHYGRVLFHRPDLGISTSAPEHLRYIQTMSKDFYTTHYPYYPYYRFLTNLRGRLSSIINIPSYVAEDALLIIKKFLKKRVRDSLKMREIVVSALYLSMMRYKLDRPGLLNIFCEYASVDLSRAERAVKIIREILNINGKTADENIDVEDEIVRRKIDEIKRFLRGYINMLINEEMKRICVETASTEILNMLREGLKKDLSMLNMLKSDRHIALTIIYMSSLVCKADVSLRKLDVKEHLIQRPTANKYMKFIRRVLENVQTQRSPLIEQLFKKLDERRNRCPKNS